MTEYKNLYALAAELGAELGSHYRDNRLDRSNILNFMEINEWFGVPFFMKELAPWFDICHVPAVREALSIWLVAYRKPAREKAKLLLGKFNSTYPDTCRLYSRFLTEQGKWDTDASWKLLDFMFSEIDKDLTKFTEKEIATLVMAINSDTTRVVAKLFADFLTATQKYGSTISGWVYTFDARDAPERINDAYSFEDFSIMAYCVFNKEMWEKQQMIEKAVQSKTFADLWLFVALHFICALRKSDMGRLPAPSLPYTPDVVLSKIFDGIFNKSEAVALVEELTIRLELNPIKPSKTSRHKNIPDIKLIVPESLKAPLGTIMAITLAHRSSTAGEVGFVKPADNMENARKFFGNDFAKAMGNRRFSSRRCNKSYLQGIEITGADEPGKPKGYMLAALARGHKNGIGKLAETTAVYLKDARFGGYSPEFIIAQMFERGVFSFIPAALLEIYAGDDYVKLPVKSETQLIGQLGLTASQVEGLAETVQRAMIRSRKAVKDIIGNISAAKENIGSILQNIASGSAPGKQNGCLCLMTAAGLPCPFAGRDGCIGCGYEIYTKTMMYTLMREYAELARLMDSSVPAESQRYSMILEQAVTPAIEEMLACAKLFYPNANVDMLVDIVEVEFNDVDSDTGGNGRWIQTIYPGTRV